MSGSGRFDSVALHFVHSFMVPTAFVSVPLEKLPFGINY
jgi:hypothetical protein